MSVGLVLLFFFWKVGAPNYHEFRPVEPDTLSSMTLSMLGLPGEIQIGPESDRLAVFGDGVQLHNLSDFLFPLPNLDLPTPKDLPLPGRWIEDDSADTTVQNRLLAILSVGCDISQPYHRGQREGSSEDDPMSSSGPLIGGNSTDLFRIELDGHAGR